MPLAIVPSFSRGELAPGLHGRVDTAVYHVGLATARNVFIHSSGGVSNRAGLQFVGPAADHTRTPRLIPFKFKATDTYILEFGNLYMRVIRSDAHVTETAVNITGATAANPVVITAAAHGYANGDEVLISGVGGMTQLNGRRFLVANKATNTFELTDQVTSANINGTAYTAYTSGGTTARIYEIATPYVEADLEQIKFTQSADVMTLTHVDYAPRELARTGHAAWTLTVISFSPDQAVPTALAATVGGAAGATTYKHKVTAINGDTLEESLSALNNITRTITGITAANPAVVTSNSHGYVNGDEVEISGVVGMTELNGRRFTVASATTNTFALSGEDSTAYTAYSSAGSANLTHVVVTNGNATLSAANNVALTWTAPTGATRYAVYRYDNGLYGLIGETEVASFTDTGQTADFDSSPPRFVEPFLGTDNAPGAVSYYEQRQVFGGSNNEPDTSRYSQTGAYHNMSVSQPSQPSDAITATLNSQEVNHIRHYIPLNDLLILTSGEEWRVNASETEGFAGTTLRQKPQSRWGAGHQRPIVIGSTVIFVPENNAGLRSLGYALNIDGYTGSDLALTSKHLFRTRTITDSGLAHARGVDALIAMVRDNGTVAVLSFEQEQEVLGWSRWDTPGAGQFESVAAVRPSSTEADDAFYFVVRRTINGSTVRYIERVHNRRFEEVQDCFFVDSGVSLDSPIDISAVTLASPCVVTATAHGFANGDEVDIHGITWVPDTDEFDGESQPDQLNGRRFTVRNKATNTFELEDDEGVAVDSSAFNAYVSGGEVRLATLTISAPHLIGETVVALADGSVVKDLTVGSTGTITLARKASRIHAGLAYTADVELLNLEPRAGENTAQGKLKHVPSVTVRFEQSRGIWAGPNSARLIEMKQRLDEAYGVPTRLLTGDAELTLPPDWNSNGRVFFRQRDPLPMTILAVIPRLEAED